MTRRLRLAALMCGIATQVWFHGTTPLPAAEEEPLVEVNVGAIEPGDFEFDFFPDESVVAEAGDDPDPITDEAQLLRFGDGTSLSGRLVGFDAGRDTIIWARKDASKPLEVPAAEVSSVSLTSKKLAPPQGRATVKFTGGDWITGTVTKFDPPTVSMQVPSGPELALRRDQIEWIYFATEPSAPECYEGPTSLAGWVSDGSWSFQEGALRAKRPSPIGRYFEALPDRCEYLIDVEQVGDQRAFSLVLRNTSPLERGIGPGRVQLMFSGTDLRLWAQIGEEMKMEQVDLRRSGILPVPEVGSTRKRIVRYRILDDFTGGRIVVLINGKKIGDWNIAKSAAGQNRGGLTFQPMVWNPDADLSLTRVRVMPWDGQLPAEEDARESRETDVVSLTDSTVKAGEIRSFDGVTFALNSGTTETSLAAADVRMVYFRRPENPPDEDPAIARLRLATGGEFDVSALQVDPAHVIARATFCPEMKILAKDLSGLSFPGQASAPDVSSDTLVFASGERLRGRIVAAAAGKPLQWKTNGSPEPVEILPSAVAGVVLSPKPQATPSKPSLLARFRNGDLLAGEVLGMDRSSITMQSEQAGRVAVMRNQLQALYFAKGGQMPALDGSVSPQSWTSGEDFRRLQAQRTQRPAEKPAATLTPWRYFDGSYTYHRPDAAPGSPYNRSNPFLGRILESLPQTAEVSFVVTSRETPTFSVQLFSDPGSPGYMLQFQADSLYLHDMGPRPRGGGVFQQQFPFEGKLKPGLKRRAVRVMAERQSGRLLVTIDGVLIGSVVRKAGDRASSLGQGIAFYPQTRVPCTFSQLWIGPWDGRVEERPTDEALPHSALLANGDEAVGEVTNATSSHIQLKTEVGELELPTDRIVMLRLGSSEPVRGSARLRLAGIGTLTVTNFAVENGKVTCTSTVAGNLELPLTALQEIAFSNPEAKPESAGRN